MATPWMSDTYKPLDVSSTQGAPHALPQKFIEWLTKFAGNNVVFAKQHVARLNDAFEAYAGEHEDVVLKLFVKSLEGDAGQWFGKLPAKSIKSWGDLMKVFMVTWDVKIEPKFLLNALYEIKKKGNETVNEFNLRFQHILDKIPDEMMHNGILRYECF